MKSLITHKNIHLPFLASLCWQTGKNYDHLEPFQRLTMYERGWRFKGVIADLGNEEAEYVRALVNQYGSYLHV